MAHDGFWGDFFYGEAEYLHNLRRDGWHEKEADGSWHWRFDPAKLRPNHIVTLGLIP